MKNRFSQIITFIQLSLLLSSNVFAEVVVDVTAAANKQAALKQAANGMTYVNIQAPNSSGLSHNVYTKFNVDPVGLVLNNSVTDTKTKLVGWVEGNTLLGGKSAKTILNEVNSNSQSTLRGFIEVAGSKASVIVANPNGIMVDGGGFINVNRAVLTTGAPIITNGDLTGYRVTGGHISIDGAGMDSVESDYTDIIARTAALSSKIWANNLNIVAGTNDVSFDTKSVTSSDSASKPVYAIDTGALGGMYAGKIRLIATEAGVGVRNNGEISATSELVISANGKLENASKIYSAGSISTSTMSDTVNTGTMYSTGDTNIDTNATLNNSGIIAAYGNLSVKANTISNKLGATMAAGLDENATISKTTSILGLKAVLIDNKAELLASNINIGDGSDTLDNTGTINAVNTYINVQNLNNQIGGKIYGDNVAIQAESLTNYSAIASRNDLNIGATNILNKDGALIYSLGNMYIGGALDANKLAVGRATTLANSSAMIESMGGMYLASQSITNTNNNFVYEWVVDRSARQTYYSGNSYYDFTDTYYKPAITTTAPAKILSAGNMILDTDALVNYQSDIASGGNMGITTNNIDNQSVTAQQPWTRIGIERRHEVVGKDCGMVGISWKCKDKWGDRDYAINSTYYVPVIIDSATRKTNTNDTSLKTIDNSNALTTASAMVTVNPDPTAQYLMELDPNFADKSKWLTSGYMLSKLAYDPVAANKRAGDGFYEQKLITQQIGQLTGKRFINGYNDDNTQFQALMDNAINQAGSLKLKIGASLSAAQVAALSSDIVWMVEKTMTLPDGTTQKVLTPQVYLASNSVSLTPQGALISANNTAYINASGTVTNSGVIKSGNATYVLAKDVANRLGEVGSDGALAIASANSVTNTQGTFSSKGDMSLAAGKDININGANITSGGNAVLEANNNINVGTLTTNKAYGSVRETNNIASSITVAKALSTTSGANTIINGSTINADTANITAISGNIEVKSVKDLKTIDYNAGNHEYHSVDETIKGSAINTKGDLNIIAANMANKENAGNILISSSSLNSANANANLSASKDVSITVDKELHSEYDKRTSSSKGLFSSKSSTTETNKVSNIIASSAITAKNVNISSGNDAKVEASNVIGSGDVSIVSVGDMNVLAGLNSTSSSTKSSTKGFLSSKASYDAVYKEQVVASNIQGNNVILSSGKTATLEAANIKANDNIIVDAKSNINVVAKEYGEGEIHETKKSSMGGLSKSMSLNQKDSINLNSALLKTEAANIVLKSGNDINIIASEVNAKADVQLQAFNKLLIAAGQTKEASKSVEEKSSFNIGSAMTGMATLGLVKSGPLYSATSDKQGLYAKGAVASNITAGNGINANSGSTQLVGSNITANGDINIKSDTGATDITTAVTSKDTSSQTKEIKVDMASIIDFVKSDIEQATSGATKVKTRIATASLDESSSQTKTTTNIASNITSKQGSVKVDSLDSITVKGSNVAAKEDVSLSSTIGNVAITEAMDGVTNSSKQKSAKAEISATVQNEYVEIASAVKAALESAQQLKKVKEDYDSYKKEVGNLGSKLSSIKQDYKNKVVGIDYNDIEDMQDIIDNVKSKEKYYVAAVAAATADLATKTVAVASQAATAAASSGTWGFSVGLALDVKGSESKSDSSQTTALASNVTANNIKIATDATKNTNVTVSGSNLVAANDITIDTHDLNIKSSESTTKSTFGQKDLSGSLSMTMYGGGGAALSLGYGEQHASAESLTNTNSLVKANTLNITASNDATIKGATLRGDDTVNLKVGNNLSLESVRDESSTSSYGSNVGMGVGLSGGSISSVSASAGMNSADSLNKKVVLSSITGDKVNVDVANNTNLKGSLIAAGSEDTNGNFVDNNNLKLSTNTVTFSNLSNTSYGSSTGLQAGVSVSTANNSSSGSSVSYGASTSLGYSVTKTLATLGKGDITIKDKENSDDLARLNTDTSKVNKELYSGGISSSVSGSLDTRLLTKDGQKKIAEDFVKTGMIINTVKEIATNSTVGITDFDTEVKKRNTTYEAVKQRIASDPELAKQLSNPSYTDAQKNTIINEVTNEVLVQLGYKPIDTKLVSTTEPGRDGQQVKGYFSNANETGTSYVNDKYNSSNYELLKTSATEGQRAIDAQNGSKFDQSQEYRNDRSAYSQNFGSNVANYTDFALYYTNQGSLSTSTNLASVPVQATSMPSVFNNQVANNNIEFAGLDKSKGDNLPATELSQDNPKLNDQFGPRVHPVTKEIGKMHYGVDINYFDDKGRKIKDSTISSAGDGIVTKSGWDEYGGNRLQIYHPESGYSTQYMHAKKLLVKEGELVREGQPVIVEGKTGRVTGEHLHFGVFGGKTLKEDKSNYIDPMTVNVGKYEKLENTPYQQGINP